MGRHTGNQENGLSWVVTHNHCNVHGAAASHPQQKILHQSPHGGNYGTYPSRCDLDHLRRCGKWSISTAAVMARQRSFEKAYSRLCFTEPPHPPPPPGQRHASDGQAPRRGRCSPTSCSCSTGRRTRCSPRTAGRRAGRGRSYNVSRRARGT